MRMLLFAVAVLAAAMTTARADIRATTEDGRTVLLKDDGTYQFLEPIAADLLLSDDDALVRIRQELGRTERSMTGAPCVGPDTFRIENIEIVERDDAPTRIDIVADVTVRANSRVPNGSSWDSCFEFAFGGNGAEQGQQGAGQLRFVFRRSAGQWRLD
jgi:hypothetical protein